MPSKTERLAADPVGHVDLLGLTASDKSTNAVSEKSSFDMYLLYRNNPNDSYTLSELGLLDKIKEAVESNTKVTGKKNGSIQSRFINQIKNGGDPEFINSYDFTSVKFAIGSATVSGLYKGVIEETQTGTIYLEGTITYAFYDVFTDPYDTFNLIPGEWNPDGKPYAITDTWKVSVQGQF